MCDCDTCVNCMLLFADGTWCSGGFPAVLTASLKQTNSEIPHKTTEHRTLSGVSDSLYNDWPTACPHLVYCRSSSEFFEEQR